METKEIGPYAILQNLGKGGMGEVFLVKDPSSGRSVALKRIRPELQNNKTIQSRFLREAKVASFLSHPSIVPILSIESTPPEIYYTMSFVEGETLRQLLKKIREGNRDWSILSLTRLFLQVCEAIAYTHSRGILHRDLKPENIIIGKYGEVMILDWGIADFMDQIEKEEPLSLRRVSTKEELTRPGKIAGTLAYMAPERLGGKSSSPQTDIYALGVILYQLLTLELPFQRKTIAAFRKQAATEELIDPTEMAPYRDIPHQLAAVASKCLAKLEKSRYQTVGELIADVKNYIEGRPQWIFLGKLDLKKKEDWQFQENILPVRHLAITRNLDVTEWAALMISQRSFTENLRLTAELQIGISCRGIGLLFCLPEADERKSLEEGYCLWLSSSSSQLFRNNVQVLELSGAFLMPNQKHQIQIEKSGDQLKLFFNGELKMNYASLLPLAGKHIGFLYKDGDFSLENIQIYDGSHNVTVNCLAVPNALLSHKLYDLALQEYRRIGQCFPGRMEGREALFRAGLTLLEKGKAQKEEQLFHLALKEFEKLYRTPGAPFEYLGKSLVYDALGDHEEEAKCLELALRKFPNHPLLSTLKEHIHYRMHESSLNNRQAAYQIILLAIRNIPDLLENGDTRSLLDSLQKNWESLPFMEETSCTRTQMAIELTFWLRKTPILVEIANQILAHEKVDEQLLGNALFSLLALEAPKELEKFPSLKMDALKLAVGPLSRLTLPKQLGKAERRSLQLLLQNALKKEDLDPVLKTLDKLKSYRIPKEERATFDAIEVWCHLLQHRPSLAGALLRKYSTSFLTQETSPFHFPYGTWLYVTKGPKAASLYFSSVLETPHPPTTSLPSHFLAGRVDDKKGWIEQAFWWEKKELQRQLELFYRVVGKKPS